MKTQKAFSELNINYLKNLSSPISKPLNITTSKRLFSQIILSSNGMKKNKDLRRNKRPYSVKLMERKTKIIKNKKKISEYRPETAGILKK